MSRRREFFQRIAQVSAGFWAGNKALAQQQDHSMHGMTMPAPSAGATSKGGAQQTNASGQKADGREQGIARNRLGPPSQAANRDVRENVPVYAPDLPKLPFKMVDGWKEFQLIAEPVRFEMIPGKVVDAWGYNGSVPGPTIEVNQGDKVRVVFTNKLPEPTAVHWHGFEVPMEMDGSVGLGQDPVPPGGTFKYEFELHQAGTFFYHSHMAMQEMMGMLGLFIMHPQEPYWPHVDRDFGIILQEWALLPNNTVPNTLSMEFNWLTFNGKSGPATTPMLVKQGERVRIRLINIGMDHHPIHLHGNQFVVTGTEGGRGPVHGWVNENTVLVGVAQARDIEFDAKYVGDWMLHCHLPHHMMNQMVSMVGPLMSSMHGGMGTGASMEDGMGMLRQGDALSGEFGPAMGRGLGMAADADRRTSNAIGPAPAAMAGMSMGQTAQGDSKPAAPAAEVWTCPMETHRDVRQSAPGKCPKCGMTLVKLSSLKQPAGAHAGHDMGQTGHTGQQPGAEPFDPLADMYPKDDPAKKQVKGYPQDMWMVEDGKYEKPETHGLRAGWTGSMMGMMTLVRVLPPEKYDEIMRLKAQADKQPKPQPAAAGHEHHQMEKK